MAKKVIYLMRGLPTLRQELYSDRDSKQPEIYILQGNHYEQRIANADGWVRSDVTGIELRTGTSGKLTMRLVEDETTQEELPED